MLSLELIILDLDNFSAKVEDEAPFILLNVSKILNFLLPDQIILASTIFLIDECFSSKQYAIARHDIEFVQNDDIARN